MWNSKYLIVLFLALVAMLVLDSYRAVEHELTGVQWVSSASKSLPSPDQKWRSGNYANIGFSDQNLHFLLNLSDLPESGNSSVDELETDDRAYERADSYLNIFPTYLDRVEVAYIDANDQVITRQVKGDKNGDTSLASARDIDQYVFSVPAGAVSAHIVVSSTSNLRATVNYVSDEGLFRNMIKRLLVKVAVFVFLFVALIMGALVGWTVRSSIYLWFAAYLLTWIGLIVGFSNMLVVFDANLSLFNDRLVSWSAIWASIFGQVFFYQLLSSIIRPHFLLRFILVMAAVGVVNFLLYLWVDERLGLSLNILSLLIVSVLLLFWLPFMQAKGRLAAIVMSKVRVPFALLLLFVLLSSAGGLGQGTAYTLNYLHATFTVFFSSYFLWLWFIIERRQSANRVIKSRAMGVINTQLNKQLEEQKTLFSMLFHEIKTPLSSLKFVLYGWVKKEQADVQVDHINHVLEQVELMHSIGRSNRKIVPICLLELVNENWNQLTGGEYLLARRVLRSKGNTQISTNRFLLHSIIKNLLDNAIKYSPNSCPKILIFGINGTCHVRVTNRILGTVETDFSKVAEKYWRAQGNYGVRGTGLGLWLVTQLCKQLSISIKLEKRHQRFSATLEIPCVAQ